MVIGRSEDLEGDFVRSKIRFMSDDQFFDGLLLADETNMRVQPTSDRVKR